MGDIIRIYFFHSFASQQLPMSLHRQLASRALQSAARTPIKAPRAATSIERQLCAYLQSFLLPGLRRGLMLSTPLILSTPLLAYQYRHAQAIRCDSADPLAKLGDMRNSYAHEAQTPIIKQSGAPNPKAVRQISMGSIFGVLGGLGVSVFSKPLAILIGLGVVLLQVSNECSGNEHKRDM
jgi:hypothetical protein